MVFVLGDRLLVAVCCRCSGVWVRLFHLRDSVHWGVPSCMLLVDVGCCSEDPGVRRAVLPMNWINAATAMSAVRGLT